MGEPNGLQDRIQMAFQRTRVSDLKKVWSITVKDCWLDNKNFFRK